MATLPSCANKKQIPVIPALSSQSLDLIQKIAECGEWHDSRLDTCHVDLCSVVLMHDDDPQISFAYLAVHSGQLFRARLLAQCLCSEWLPDTGGVQELFSTFCAASIVCRRRILQPECCCNLELSKVRPNLNDYRRHAYQMLPLKQLPTSANNGFTILHVGCARHQILAVGLDSHRCEWEVVGASWTAHSFCQLMQISAQPSNEARILRLERRWPLTWSSPSLSCDHAMLFVVETTLACRTVSEQI